MVKSKLTVHKQIYDSSKKKVTNLVDKAKQAYYSTKIQSSTTCKQLFQNFKHHPRQKQIFTFSFNIWLWRPPECFFLLLLLFPPPPPPPPSFWLLQWENPHNQKIFLNNQQCICQVLWTWSHSHHASLWIPWHPLADHHEHHQHISYHWHCTTWSEDSCRQTSVEKAITWQNSFEKLTSHF